MRLDWVDIENFRSIKSLRIQFNYRCLSLIGLNESGKSNILKALSLLGDEYKLTPDDIRMPFKDEPAELENAFVRFLFKFNAKEIKEIFDAASSVMLSRTHSDIIDMGGKKLTLNDWIKLDAEGIYEVDIIKNEKSFNTWEIDCAKYKINTLRYKKLKENLPESATITNKDGSPVQINKYKIVDVEDFNEIDHEFFDINGITQEFLDEIVSSAKLATIKKYLPACRYWSYREEYNLPARINIDEFKENPNMCIPLRNMFYIAGVKEIKSTIEERKKTPKGIINLLNLVAEASTKHISSIWKEQKVKFDLMPNADFIEAGIKDEFNSFQFATRSDGFKRFVTFLLLISAEQRKEKLTNTLILFDEPDIGIHPKGIKYMLDELINISEDNYVVFSSHSIFMVDKDHIDRHLLVKKHQEKTEVTVAEGDRIKEEEVVYNALGYSIYESIEKNVVIFEGWRDKNFFNVAVEGARKSSKNDYKSLKK